MAAVQMPGLHGAHACIAAGQRNSSTKMVRNWVSKAPCSVSSCSSLSRGALLSYGSLIKVEGRTRVCSLVEASSASAAIMGDAEGEGEGDGASRREWVSPMPGNPMDGWLRKGDEREGDAWREECGVVAIFGDPEASRLCYLSLHALQHRGQEGAGIVTADGNTLHAVTGAPGSSWSCCSSSRRFRY